MSGRRLGAAVALGIVFALFLDLLLQSAQVAIRILPSRVNWQAAVIAKGLWLLVVAIVGVVAPVVWPGARTPMAWSSALGMAGGLLIATPIIWMAATLLRFAANVTLASGWGTDGRVLLQPAFYSEIAIGVGPWLLAGSGLRLLADHAPRKAP